MTAAECEIVANAGVQLREIAERLTLPAGATIRDFDRYALVSRMDAAALSISEVYGQLSALPLETPVTWECPDCGYLSPAKRFPESHSSDCPRAALCAVCNRDMDERQCG